MTDQTTEPPGSALQLLSVGLLTATVGFASAFTIVLQGLASAGASPAEAASGLLARNPTVLPLPRVAASPLMGLVIANTPVSVR